MMAALKHILNLTVLAWEGSKSNIFNSFFWGGGYTRGKDIFLLLLEVLINGL